MALQIDKEKAKKNIAFVLDRLESDIDYHLLNEYRAIFKKEVSLFRRSWAAAYMLMNMEQGGGERGDHRLGKGRRPQRDSRSAGGRQADGADVSGRSQESGGENRGEAKQYTLAEEESNRLFISIGRNRRVFAREILGLIIARAGTPREDIGVIRILDNYSFVQVKDSAAEEIIEALNGQTFRGRTLTVNYAKIRKDEEETEADAQENGIEDSESVDDEPVSGGDDYADIADSVEDTGISEQGQDQPDEEDI